MKIGLYFGSFNPIHVGHLIIANHVLNETDVEKIWFIVSPQNPFKESASLLNEYDRLHLVRVAVEDDPRMKESDIEFHLPKPSYTVNTLAYLAEKYPEHEFTIIMGSDSFENLTNWKNGDFILNNYNILVYLRPSHEKVSVNNRVQILKAPLLDISATHIRELSRTRKSIRHLVPEKVREEIERSNYYK